MLDSMAPVRANFPFTARRAFDAQLPEAIRILGEVRAGLDFGDPCHSPLTDVAFLLGHYVKQGTATLLMEGHDRAALRRSQARIAELENRVKALENA